MTMYVCMWCHSCMYVCMYVRMYDLRRSWRALFSCPGEGTVKTGRRTLPLWPAVPPGRTAAIHTYIHTYTHTIRFSNIRLHKYINIHTYIYTYILHTSASMQIHTYIHTYIHAYIHGYLLLGSGIVAHDSEGRRRIGLQPLQHLSHLRKPRLCILLHTYIHIVHTCIHTEHISLP